MRRTAALLFALALVTSVGAQAFAAISTQVALEAFPAALTIDGRGTTRSQLLVQNGESEPLTGLVLSWTASAGSVCITEASVTPPSPGVCPSMVSVDLAPAAVKEYVLLGTDLVGANGVVVHVIAHFQVDSEEGPIPGAQTLTLTAPPVPTASPMPTASPEPVPTSPPALATFSIATSITTLTEARDGDVFLTIANTTGAEIRRVEVRAWAPKDMSLNGVACSGDATVVASGEMRPACLNLVDVTTLDAGASRTYDVKVSTPTSILPADQLLVFEVAVDTRFGRASTVLTKTFNVAVQGESKLLELLSVPILFLLPGVIFVVVHAMVSKQVFGRNGDVTALDLTLWAKAVPASLWLIYTYRWLGEQPLIVRAFHPRGDLLAAHDLTDIALVWTYAVVAGGGLVAAEWIGREGFAYLKRLVAEIRRRRSVIAPSDSQVSVLRKLARGGHSLMLDEVADSEGRRGFVVGGLPKETKDITVLPGIQIQVAYPKSREDRVALASLKSNLVESGKPSALADKLVAMSERVSVGWVAGLRSVPGLVSSAELKAVRSAALIPTLETDPPPSHRQPAPNSSVPSRTQGDEPIASLAGDVFTTSATPDPEGLLEGDAANHGKQ